LMAKLSRLSALEESDFTPEGKTLRVRFVPRSLRSTFREARG
jgi:hypothetical protein